MKHFRLPLALILTLGAPLAVADETVIDQPMTATTLHFPDRTVSAFYTVEHAHFNVVVAIAAGAPAHEQLIRQTFQLDEGQSYRLSIGGYGSEERATTLRMTRQHDRILANVTTCESKQQMANCI